MAKQYITMSQKEIKRYDIIQEALASNLSAKEAGRLLNLSTRQIRRLKVKVKNKGIKGLIHQNRGKPSKKKIPEKEKQVIIELLHKYYYDFGPTFASEKLEELHNIKRDPKTIRAIMISEGLWKPKQKKKDKHRSWRQRRAQQGELVQYDGSYHHWFGDSLPKTCLLASIDDANSEVFAQFDEHEGVFPTFRFWESYIDKYGKPHGIYVDRFSTYSMNHKLAKENEDTLTQFQRAMEQGLNIEIVHAKSAEAKGRVEVLFKTLQDRLVKELRLRNISTTKEANEFLREEFLPKFNARFMVVARSKANLHKKLSKKEKKSLNSIFSRQYERVVRNDFTLSYKTKYYQLTDSQPATVCKKDTVTIEERENEDIRIRLRGKYLNYEILPEKAKKLNNSRTWVIPKSKAHKPAPNHPWRQYQNTRNFNN